MQSGASRRLAKPGEGLRPVDPGDLFASDPEVMSAALATWAATRGQGDRNPGSNLLCLQMSCVRTLSSLLTISMFVIPGFGLTILSSPS